jgi:hypothetical protein
MVHSALLLWVVARDPEVLALCLIFACPFSATSCGDVVANTITGGTAKTLASNGDAALGCASGSLEFRSYLLVKAQAQVGGTSYSLDQAEVDAAINGFMTIAPDWVQKLSGGRLCFVPEAYASPDALTSFTDTCGGPTPWMADVAGDLQALAPAGKYDTVFIYAPNGGSRGSCAYWPTAASNLSAFAYLDPPGAAGWQDPNHYIYEHVIWAWLIGFYGFYRGLSGVEPPAVPDPSNGGNYGYARDQAPYSGWMTWYSDLLLRKVMQSGAASGLGEPAWSHGTIRAAAVQ